MTSHPPNAVTGLPYTLVDLDEPKKSLGARIQEADSVQWKLWITRYAWLVSLVTMAPGIALLAFVITGSLAFGLFLAAAVTVTPGVVFWRRTRQLP